MYYSFTFRQKLLTAFLLVTAVAGAQTSMGRITVDTMTTTGQISPLIYGVGVEWIERGNGLQNPSGELRPDVIALLKPLSIPVIRFPGGILADYYNWTQGIGPLNSRPAAPNPMSGEMYPSTFGTDEFIQLCRSLGSEALVTANFGTGTLNEALAWQRYFQSQGFPAKYWEIGNEIYLTGNHIAAMIPGNDVRIFKTNEQYGSAISSWANALRAQDPSALVGAVGGLYNVTPEHAGWLNTLLAMAPRVFDFLALHDSFAPIVNDGYDMTNGAIRAEIYKAMYTQAAYAAEDVQMVKRMLAGAGSQQRIAITEHFPLFGGSTDNTRMLALIDQTRTLGSALFTASLFHSYIRQNVWMANYNLTLSAWFGALLTDTPNGLVRTPTYHVYDMFRNHFGNTAVAVAASGPTYNSYQIGNVPARGGVQYLDVVAATDGAGHSYLSVINRSGSGISAQLSATGLTYGKTAEVWTLAGPAQEAVNGPNLSPTTVRMGTEMIPVRSSWRMPSSGTYRFPGSSVTILKW